MVGEVARGLGLLISVCLCLSHYSTSYGLCLGAWVLAFRLPIFFTDLLKLTPCGPSWPTTRLYFPWQWEFAVYSPPVLLATAEHRAAADTSTGMMCQPPFTVTTSGPAPLTAALADALQAQWQLGFPRTPDGVDQLTNGFYTYPAALQPLASRHLMRVVPDGPLLDPFCGSGTLPCRKQGVAQTSASLCLSRGSHSELEHA